MFYILVIASCIISSALAGAHGYLEERAEPNENCDVAFKKVWNLLETLKANYPEKYEGEVTMLSMQLGANFSNPVELKPLFCKFLGFRTLKEAYAALNTKGSVKYAQVVESYKYIQDIMSQFGGYSNIPRIYEMAKDVFAFANSSIHSGHTQKRDLAVLTRFFEVMQVKYGSRWLSFVTSTGNQMVLVEDPQVMATNLYACNHTQDIADLLSIDNGNVHFVYWSILGDKPTELPAEWLQEGGIMTITAQAYILLGEYGFFTLDY